MPAQGIGAALPFRRDLSFGCAYPLDADSTEVGSVGFLPLALSNNDQTAAYTIDGAPASNRQAIAFQSGATGGTASTLNLTAGKKVVQFATTMPATVGGGGATVAYQVEHTLSTIGFSTIAQVKFERDADGNSTVLVYLGASLVLTTTPSSFPSVIDLRFDCDGGTAAVAFDGVVQSLSANTFTPAQALPVIVVYEKTDSPAGDAGQQIVVSLRTVVGSISGYQPGDYGDACGNPLANSANAVVATDYKLVKSTDGHTIHAA